MASLASSPFLTISTAENLRSKRSSEPCSFAVVCVGLLTCEYIIAHIVSIVNTFFEKKVDIVRKLCYGVLRKR